MAEFSTGKLGRPVTGVVIALLVIAAGWYSLWTFADPWVEVGPPVTVRLASGSAAGHGTVLFLGDTAPTDAAMPEIERHGWGYPFEATRALLAGYDAVVVNLEAPVTASDERWPVPKPWIYEVDPAAVPAMRAAGIDAVTLANNHVRDFGSRGLADTLTALDRGGIAHLGAGMTEAEARRGLVLETAGGRVGLLAYLQNRVHWRLRDMAFALDTPMFSWPGAARLRYSDLAEDLARLRAASDVVVVVLHWGSNYEPVEPDQIALGRAAIDLGADAVIGHHSHQAQPVGLYRGRPIIFGLGNYAFGTIGRASMRFGMGAALHLEQGRIAALELIPLATQNRLVSFRPRVSEGRQADRFFEDLRRRSAALGAAIVQRGERGWLKLDPPIE